MGHRDGRPVAAAPTLVGDAERRGRAADRVYFRVRIVGVNLFRRRASFRHGLGVKSPVLIPGHFGFADKERRNGHFFYGAFVVPAERFVVRAAHCESSSGDRFHVKRYGRTGDGFGKILECGYGSRFGERFAFFRFGLRDALHFRMRIVRIVMAYVQMAADTLQVEFLFVFFVVEMGGDTFLTEPRREQLLMALLA